MGHYLLDPATPPQILYARRHLIDRHDYAVFDGDGRVRDGATGIWLFLRHEYRFVIQGPPTRAIIEWPPEKGVRTDPYDIEYCARGEWIIWRFDGHRIRWLWGP